MKKKVVMFLVFALLCGVMFGEVPFQKGDGFSGKTIFYCQTTLNSVDSNLVPAVGGVSGKILLSFDLSKKLNIQTGVDVGVAELGTSILANGGLGYVLFEDKLLKGELIALAGLGGTIDKSNGETRYVSFSFEGLFNLGLDFNKHFGITFSTGFRHLAHFHAVDLSKRYLPLGISLKIFF